MKVLVCGSRHFNDYELLKKTLDELPTITEIIEGEARGADSLGKEYGIRRGITVRAFPAFWDKHGKAAGAIRNNQMLSEGKPDMVLAFLARDSRGTKHMIEIAQKAGVETKIVNIS